MAEIAQVWSAADWRGSQVADDPGWRLPLSSAQQDEVLVALAVAQGADVPLDSVSREVFPLPTLGVELRRLADDVVHGRGFALVQGVPVDALTEEQCVLVAVGISAYIGDLVPQGPQRAPVVHVRDGGADAASSITRSYQHSGRLGFHADPTDVVALLCLRPARSGGLSAIVSSVAVHNALVAARPDLARLLYEPWWFDRRTGDGPDSFYQQPVYAIGTDGRLSTRYGPDYIRSAQRGAHVPALDADRVEAMEALDRLNHAPDFLLTMELRPGDLQLLNNRVILHSRTAYEDHPEPERRRHLLRLWLDM
ncbi:TauD/TfdA family dioxygenase [Micromonospora sp. NPDC047738]|uniref:TauD/TfdA family dioxygenase n=1 Tax=Micromonospora sp. NPDC047738 TaxID=3155741 RepID=UPI0033DE1AD6